MKKLLILLLLVILSSPLFSQPWLRKLPAGKTNQELLFSDYQKAFNDYWAPFGVENGYYIQNGMKIKAAGWKQFKRWEYEMEAKVSPSTGKLPDQDGWSVVQKFQADNPDNTMAAWTPLGPSSSGGGYAGIGRLNCIAFHPTNANIYWVGAASGGLWVTINNGSSWTCLTDASNSLAVSDIVIPPDYATSNTIYIATGDKDHWDNRSVGVLKSTDGGASWNQTGISYTIGQGKMVNRLLMNPSDYQVLIAATSDGVYKTTNGGGSWSALFTSPGFIDMEFKPGDFNTLYGSTTSGSIYQSTNAGVTWVECFNDGNAFRVELAVSSNQPTWVYALMANSSSGLYGVYKSTNSGTSFSQVFSGNTKNLLGWDSNGGDSGGQGWYDLSLAVSPSNASTVLLGGVNTWRSTDGGTSWTIVNHWWGDGVPAAHADKHWLSFRPNGDLFECNDGGIYISTNAGTSWTDKTNGMVLSQMYKLGVSATVANEVITGLQDNGTKLFTGGGWSDVKGGDGMECIIDYTNVNIQYGTYVNGQISRTMNHWVTATDIQPGDAGDGAWVTPYIIDPANPQILYAGYADIWKTTNRGDSWIKISDMNTPDKIRSMAIAPSNSQVLYAADPFILWKTTNGGSSWSNITGTLPTTDGSITAICVKNNDTNTLWVTLGGFNANLVYESSNGGASWTNISAGLPPIPAYSIVQNKQSTSQVQLYIGTEVGVYIKKGTENWGSFNSGLPNVRIGELEISYNATAQNSKLRAATYGRGLWETPVLYSPVPMTYVSATTNHPTTGDVAPGQVNQAILCVEIVTNGDQTPMSATSFTFNTNGSTNPMSDISNAKLYYTGASNVFSPTAQAGTTFNAPGGVFTITGTQLLTGGSNFFWLTYDLPVNAVRGNVVDAQCTSITVGSARTPAVISPAGNRKISLSFCTAGSNICDEYILSVTAGTISNSTGCSQGGYGDYTNLTTTMAPGESIPVTVINSIAYVGDQCGIWVDWNANGDFTDDPAISVTGGPGDFQATISCPAGTFSGYRRMRIRIHFTEESTSPCGSAHYGEVEDYTIIVNPPASGTVSGTLASGESQCYSAQQIVSVAGSGTSFIVQAGGNALFVAGQKIRFYPGTKVNSGGYLRGYINPVNPWCIQPAIPAIITGIELPQQSNLTGLCRVYPNPTTGKIRVDFGKMEISGTIILEIYNMNGDRILTSTSLQKSIIDMSLENRPTGMYFIHIMAQGISETIKIVKQ